MITIKSTSFVFLLFVITTASNAQLMNHYWTHNYNSKSSLLGGAVIAGDAGNTAIFYNPATIGDMESGNNVSLAANLFSYNMYNFKNALGDDIDIFDDNFMVQPQFLAYSYKPKLKGVNVSVSALTRIKEQIKMVYISSDYKDIIKHMPGDEKYNTIYNYTNNYSDVWIGGAISQDVSERFSYGVSLFASISSLNYRFNYSAEAINTIVVEDSLELTRIAEGSYDELVKFTDYRLIAKIGLYYKLTNWRFGLTITSPTWRLFSSGKRAQRLDNQINVSQGDILPGFSDYSIFDGQEKDQLKTNFKLPLSVGFGFIYDVKGKDQKLYFSLEFFAPVNEYKMVEAELNTDITNDYIYDTLSNKDWTSYAYASNAVINVAVGYSWKLSNDLIFMNALRTDFSSINHADLGKYEDYNYIKTSYFNIYHYSGGVEFSVKKNRLVAGADIAFGYQKNLQQIVNFSDPVEYEESTGRALQGPLKNEMNMYYIGISLYIGATLNFTRKVSNPEK